MSEDAKQIVSILIRAMKFAISLFEKFLKGEKI